MTQRFDQIQPTEGASPLSSVTWEHVLQTLNGPPEKQVAKGEQTAKGEQPVEPHKAKPTHQKESKSPTYLEVPPLPSTILPAGSSFNAVKDGGGDVVMNGSGAMVASGDSSGVSSNGLENRIESDMGTTYGAYMGDRIPVSRYVDTVSPNAKEPWSWNEVMGASILFPLGAAEVVRQRSEYTREHARFQVMNDAFGDENSGSSFGERELTSVQINELARQFDNACNGGLTGIGTDSEAVIKILSKIPRNQMDDFDKAYRDRTGGKLGVQDELLDELSGESLEQARSLFTGQAARLDSSLNTRDFSPLKEQMESNRYSELETLAPDNLKHIYRELSEIRARHISSEESSERTLWNTMPADQRRRLTAEILTGSESSRSSEYTNLESSLGGKRQAAIERVNAEQKEYLGKLPANVRAEMANFEKQHSRNNQATTDRQAPVDKMKN